MPLPTLLVIDVQRAFDDPAWAERNNPDAEKHVRGLLAAWRGASAPVIHVRHESASRDGLFRRDTAAFEFKPEAEPLPGVRAARLPPRVLGARRRRGAAGPLLSTARRRRGREALRRPLRRRPQSGRRAYATSPRPPRIL